MQSPRQVKEKFWFIIHMVSVVFTDLACTYMYIGRDGVKLAPRPSLAWLVKLGTVLSRFIAALSY